MSENPGLRDRRFMLQRPDTTKSPDGSRRGGFIDVAERTGLILPIGECESAYYLRIQAKDHPGVLAQVASILSERGINIESIMQKEVEEHDGLVPMILVTHRVVESRIDDAIAALEGLADVVGKVVRIRVEQLV